MDRMDRFVRIHNLLKQGRPVPLARLKNELEVSRATVVRDLEYMRERMGAPIRYDRAALGHTYDPDAPAFELPGLWFNQSELYALLASEQLLEAVQPGILSPHIAPLKARIRRLLEKGGHEADAVGSRIRLLSSSRRRCEAEHFGAVAQAVLAGQVIDIAYHSRSRDERATRRVHPYRLLHYRDNWYVAAFCEKAGDLRLFSLDRIGRVNVAEAPLRSADDAAVDRAIHASFGIFGGVAEHWAVLRFAPTVTAWVAEEQWHPDQICQWVDGNYELQVPYSSPAELVGELLRFGPDVEVVAPPGLRQTVAERLAAGAAIYRSRSGSAERVKHSIGTGASTQLASEPSNPASGRIERLPCLTQKKF